MKKTVKPGIYKITLTDTKGKKYEPAKPYETYQTVLVSGRREKKWECFASFADAKAFHGATSTRSETTVRQVWNHFLANQGTRTRRTQSKHATQVKHLEMIMTTPIGEHKPTTVAGWLADLAKPEYLAKVRGARVGFTEELRLLSQLYSHYRLHFDSDFLSPIRPEHKRLAIMREAPPAKNKDLTDREFAAFLKAFTPGQARYRAFAEAQYSLYARAQEIAALRYEDFDPKTGVVEIRRRVEWPSRKGDRPKVVPGLKATDFKTIRSLEATRTLQQWCMTQGIRTGLLFQKNGEPISFSGIRDAYNAAYGRAGLERSGTHVLRHASLTEHYETNGDLYKTMKAAGHTKIDTTQRYVRHREESQDASYAKVDERLRATKAGVG